MCKSTTRFLFRSQLFLFHRHPRPSLPLTITASLCWLRFGVRLLVCLPLCRTVGDSVSDVADGSSVRSHRLHSFTTTHCCSSLDEAVSFLLFLFLIYRQVTLLFLFTHFCPARNNQNIWLKIFGNLVQFACGNNLSLCVFTSALFWNMASLFGSFVSSLGCIVFFIGE